MDDFHLAGLAPIPLFFDIWSHAGPVWPNAAPSYTKFPFVEGGKDPQTPHMTRGVGGLVVSAASADSLAL